MGAGHMRNQAGVVVVETGIVAVAVGGLWVAGAGKSVQLNHNPNAGNLNLEASGYNFGEGKGQNPNSEEIDSLEMGAEARAVEAGFGRAVLDRMMTAVEQEGMAGKKPCPSFQFFSVSPNQGGTSIYSTIKNL